LDDEHSVALSDACGFANAGTSNGSPKSTTGLSNEVDTALELNGTGQYVDLHKPNLIGGNAILSAAGSDVACRRSRCGSVVPC